MAGRRNNCVAVDESKASINAFNWYVTNYHRQDDTLILVHIHKIPKCSNFKPEQELKKLEKSIQKSKHITAKYESMCEEREIKCLTVIENDNSSVGNAICEVAAKHDASVIVVGKRGLSTLSRLVLGSTSKYILHHSQTPVIIVSEENSI